MDAVEQGAGRYATYQERVAETTQVSWIALLARANAGFTRDATRLYTRAARQLLDA